MIHVEITNNRARLQSRAPDHPQSSQRPERKWSRYNLNRDFASAFRELFVLDSDDRDYKLSCYNVSWL